MKDEDRGLWNIAFFVLLTWSVVWLALSCYGFYLGWIVSKPWEY